jgi:hypothetical protein
MFTNSKFSPYIEHYMDSDIEDVTCIKRLFYLIFISMLLNFSSLKFIQCNVDTSHQSLLTNLTLTFFLILIANPVLLSSIHFSALSRASFQLSPSSLTNSTLHSFNNAPSIAAISTCANFLPRQALNPAEKARKAPLGGCQRPDMPGASFDMFDSGT